LQHDAIKRSSQKALKLSAEVEEVINLSDKIYNVYIILGFRFIRMILNIRRKARYVIQRITALDKLYKDGGMWHFGLL
jgi:hypothetical protein